MCPPAKSVEVAFASQIQYRCYCDSEVSPTVCYCDMSTVKSLLL